jgi:REP element-mobilizing transposase RayT
MNGQGLQAVYHKLKEELGEQFDVVLESDHIHLEWDVPDKQVDPEER